MGAGRVNERGALKIYLSPIASLTGPGLSATFRAPTRHQIGVPAGVLGGTKKLLLTVIETGPVAGVIVLPRLLVLDFEKFGSVETSTTYSTLIGSLTTTELNVNV